MWNAQDIKSLMLLSGIMGVIVGAVGVAAYSVYLAIKDESKKK